MISQLRTYTINRGMMDQWVKHFTETLVPIQQKQGIKIDGMWVNEDKNQFIWVRSFADSDDLKAKEAAFYESSEWQAVVDHTRSHTARVVVQAMEPAGNASGDSLTGGTNKVSQLRIYTINRGMMDQWVKFFTETTVPIQEKQGIKVNGMWVNEDKNQFIWIRSFADAEDVKAKEAAFNQSPEWNAVSDQARSHLARLDVQTMAPVQAVAVGA
ncbi:MAG: hypothetical protein BZY88_05110 [SAR202 cluster bacterium Io17-Chloro-G9]|nr:MAG: hypothetical protein BZY88_05110 [SAR202 cluster bacterium Io17-Chloro-G9]